MGNWTGMGWEQVSHRTHGKIDYSRAVGGREKPINNSRKN